jgi:hypothetical protein
MDPRSFICEECGKPAARTAPVQRYCPGCSARRDLERKRLWARSNPPGEESRSRAVARLKRLRSHVVEAGAAESAAQRRGITWEAEPGPDLLWLVRARVPFTYAVSKNHIYTMRAAGHVALRREARQSRSAIAVAVRRALGDQRVARNKLWLDILVQKPDHRGDAVNVIDLVCDAVKDGIGLDDRWFCIRRLDWEIVKRDPELVIGIGQDSDVDCQICSHCGRAKPLDAFNRRSGSPQGVGRACRDCLRSGRRRAKDTKGASTDGTP